MSLSRLPSGRYPFKKIIDEEIVCFYVLHGLAGYKHPLLDDRYSVSDFWLFACQFTCYNNIDIDSFAHRNLHLAKIFKTEHPIEGLLVLKFAQSFKLLCDQLQSEICELQKSEKSLAPWSLSAINCLKDTDFSQTLCPIFAFEKLKNWLIQRYTAWTHGLNLHLLALSFILKSRGHLRLPLTLRILLPNLDQVLKNTTLKMSGESKKRRVEDTYTSTTAADSKDHGADAPSSANEEAYSSEEDYLANYCTAKTSKKNTGLTGCSIFVKRPEGSYSWRATKFPVKWDYYVDLRVYKDMKELQQTDAKNMWRSASFRGKISVGNPLRIQETQRLKKAVKELQAAMLESANCFPGVTTEHHSD